MTANKRTRERTIKRFINVAAFRLNILGKNFKNFCSWEPGSGEGAQFPKFKCRGVGTWRGVQMIWAAQSPQRQ